ELPAFEESEDFAGVIGANHRAQADRLCIGLRDHDAKSAGDNTNHVIALGTTVQDAVTNLLNKSNAVVRIYDFIPDFVFHRFDCPPRHTRTNVRQLCWKSQDISIGMRGLEKTSCSFGRGIVLRSELRSEEAIIDHPLR